MSSRTVYDIAQAETDKIVRTNKAFYIIVVLVILGTFFDGIEQYNSGYAAPFISSVLKVPALQLNTDVTLVTFFFFAVGAVVAGFMGDYIGRRFLYSFNLLVYTLGAVIGALAVSFGMLLLGRAVVGFGLGGEIGTGLTLLSELVPTRIRGQFTGLLNVGPGFGIFAVAALADIFLVFFSGSFGGATTAWRWFLGVMVIPALMVFFYRRYIPETPRFLISKGRVDEAFSTIKMLSDGKLLTRKNMLKNYPAEEMRKLYNYQGLSVVIEKPTYKDLFVGHQAFRSTLLFVLSFITFGVQVSITVLEPILFSSYVSYGSAALTVTTILNISSIIGTLLAAYTGRFRRKLTITGYGLVVVAMLLAMVAAYTYHFPLYLVVASLFVATTMIFAVNTTVWLYGPELYPTRTRDLGTGWVIIGTIAGVLAIVLGAASVLGSVGFVGYALLLAALYLILVIVMATVGIETVGKPLEEISPTQV
ncbi:MAG: MFS transporter [Conexivisphaerales archaeon]